MSSPTSNSAQIDFRTQLRAIPLRNEKAELVSYSDASMVFGVKLSYSGPMALAAKLMGLRRTKKYELEGLSLKLYRSLDGVKTVEDLVDGLMASYKLSFFEARALIAQYLSDLMRRGLVVVAVKKEEGSEDAGA